jgi:BBSome-interacting protein 1
MAEKTTSSRVKLSEILPKAGLVYSEKSNLSAVLCKPKIMPIKSITLEKIEAMEKELLRQQQEAEAEHKM